MNAQPSKPISEKRLTSSFRDPSGFVFEADGIIYRQINTSYAADYSQLMDSGLYQNLLNQSLLIPHHEIGSELAPEPDCFTVIQPHPIDYISYPYEWCFSQLKDAALATLKVQQLAIAKGMSLKDANGFNIQFHRGKPVLIDTLSFERYVDGEPWAAYRQFCQHFLAPLLLVSYRDYGLQKLLRTHIDGIPLPLASGLLPRHSWFRYGVLSHIHLHAKAQQRYSNSADDSKLEDGAATQARTAKVSKLGLLALLDGLESLITKLRWKPQATEWADYYSATNYEDASQQDKLERVQAYVSDPAIVEHLGPSTDKPIQKVLDLGANTGRFSRAVTELGHYVISQDIDELAVERSYLQSRETEETRILPLVQDLANPSPALGWANRERMSLQQRGPVDTVLALALIHHLAISNNVSLSMCAEYFSTLGKFLVIEFVPKSDSQVKRLLATRLDIFPAYTQDGFEQAFSKYYDLVQSDPVVGTDRVLYLYRSR